MSIVRPFHRNFRIISLVFIMRRNSKICGNIERYSNISFHFFSRKWCVLSFSRNSNLTKNPRIDGAHRNLQISCTNSAGISLLHILLCWALLASQYRYWQENWNTKVNTRQHRRILGGVRRCWMPAEPARGRSSRGRTALLEKCAVQLESYRKMCGTTGIL